MRPYAQSHHETTKTDSKPDHLVCIGRFMRAELCCNELCCDGCTRQSSFEPYHLLHRSSPTTPPSDSVSSSCPRFSYHCRRTHGATSHRSFAHTRADHSGPG